MSEAKFQGRLNQLKGKVEEKFGEFSHDEFQIIAGRHRQVVASFQEHYKITKEEAERRSAELLIASLLKGVGEN